MYKGYQTSELKEINTEDEPKPIYSFISIKNRQYIDSLIQFTSSNNIKLTLVTSPVFGGGKKNVLNKTTLSNQLKNISYINHIHYFDYTDSLAFQNSELFADYFHLNRKGALKFSQSISLTFDNILPKKALFSK
jgi:hypothetical protein